MNAYIVYAMVDDAKRITAVNSSAFLHDLAGWTKIDEGHGDRYHHAQGNYFSKPLMDDRGIWRYKLENGKAVERSQEDMDADYTEPENQLTQEERIAQLEEQNAFLTECLLEMSEIIYA